MDGAAGGEIRWRVGLWERFLVVDSEGAVLRSASRKVAELVAYLALRRYPVVQRDVLAEALWPEADPVVARNRLKQTLATARRELPGLPIRAIGKHEVEFPGELIAVDVRELAERARWTAILSGPARREALAGLLLATAGELLPGVDTPWARAEREEWAHRRRAWAREVEGDPPASAVFRCADEFPGRCVDLVGRTRELNEVARWFDRGGGRRLTLVGPPGVGKTRLSRAFFEDAAPPFDALLAVSTSQAFETGPLDRLAESLGVGTPEVLHRRLTTLLRGFERPLLFVDDLDQADPETRSWIDRLFDGVPRLRLLATARRRPADGRGDRIELVGLDDAEAADLLGRFALQAGVAEKSLLRGADAVFELATRLEGHPLALEVAAGWLAFLPPASLVERLQRCPRMLVDQPSPGGRSLANSVGLMAAALSSAEREALRTVALSRGGLGERLAERLLGDDWPHLLRRLADCSLVSAFEGAAGPRYAMLQALREAVSFVTPPEEVARLTRRLCGACVDLMRVASHEAFEAGQAAWLDWLHDETDNLLFTLETIVGDPPLLSHAFMGVVRLHAALRHPASVRRFDAAISRMNAAARLRRAEMSPVVRGCLWLEDRMGALEPDDFGAKIAIVVAAIEEGIGDEGRIDGPSNWEWVGSLQFRAGLYKESLASFERCRDLSARAGLRTRAFWMESFLAHSELASGQIEDAWSRRRRAHDQAWAMGLDDSVGVYDLEASGRIFALGEREEAAALALSAVDAFRRCHEVWRLGASLVRAAEVLLALERDEEAARLLAEAGEVLHPEQERLLARRDELVRQVRSHPRRPAE